jgi:nicotinamidase-related amidase
MLASNLKPEQLEIVPQLHPFLAQAHVVDRYVFSAFAAPELARHLEELGAETTIFTGIESDVCVLATALAAIDRGYRVIIVEDGVASSRPSAHRAVMQHVLPRFDQQVEIVKAATLARNWHAGKK